MNPTISKFESYVNAGEIEDGKPLPLVFSFRELETLYQQGYIYEMDNQFLAVVD